ncbi:LacI family transcriptional regulator [Rahnella victoriana]|uniref:LacI family DNA-binding transcriptional regulator n=1 Tax=Rahnella victoriana TaxID=1510570 RepID=UPI000BB1C8A5|nr:LacI family DNA-binding transcriptional regulator [Rahnella victoriana]PBI81636.1 LacI family transcriptional regulator [Rahnella victoriana]
MAVTIYDIARLANVSKSTVSRVITNQTNISPDARERVLAAIRTLNYQPSKLARALTSKGFDAVLVISTRSSKTTAGNPFFSEILQSIALRAEEEGFDVILQTSKNSEEDLQKCVAKITEKMVKGVILLSSPADEHILEQLDHYQVPVVVIGNIEGRYQHVFSVDTDNFQDSYRLTQHLISLGHRDIACLHAPLDYHVSIDRLAGYKRAMQDAGLPLQSGLMIDGGYTTESACLAATALLQSATPPTAVFATDAVKVMSIYRAAQEQKKTIPDALSVTGYSSDNISPILSPGLTGIEIPIRELGWQGCSLLFDKIFDRPCTDSRTLVPTQLVVNHSARNITAGK